LVIFCSYSNAQQVDQTGNLIDNSQWTGVGAYAPNPNDCCSNPAGSQPLYDTTDDTIRFSYGQATVGQIIGINNALGSSGLQVNGYTFQYDAKTTSENGGGSDPLTSSSYLKDGSGNVLASTTYQHGVHDWQTFSVSRTLTNPYSISGGGTVGVEFSGYDQGYWAGLYGPQVRNVDVRLNYSVGEDPCIKDPLSSTSCPGYAQAYKDQQCSMNPLYDTTCPGYAQAYFDQQCSLNPLYDAACPGRSAIVTSDNLVPNPGGQTGFFGGSLNNSFAINTALSHGGSGIMIHGFQWGYRAINYDFWLIPRGSSQVNVNIRDSDGTGLYSWSRSNTSLGDNWYSGSYVLPQSRNNLTLGNFDFTASSSGFGAVDNMWAKALITPDQCTLDPLSSVLCTGYQAAFLNQQCTLNTLYNPSCPGYQEAFAALLAAAIPETSTTTAAEDPIAAVVATTTTTSSTPGTTEDPTKDETAVTTDVGGAEVTATGEIVASDGVPSDVKEAVKESAADSTEKKEETAAAAAPSSSPDKKKSKVNAVALAQAAARDAEKTALSVASEAQAMSLSENANPADGIGLAGLGSGITIPGLQLLQGTGNVNNAAADNQALSSAANRSRLSDRTGDQQSANTANAGKEKDKSVDLNVAAMTVEPRPEPVAPTGPSVRRGGAVDGMSGGDMNSLAAAPANFNDYLSQQLQDAQFYASKDIYRGQRNVDNARALRGLGTDRLHQQMVDQQYNISGQ
jgi:hypothetical protein